jgi:hypothetical protein
MTSMPATRLPIAAAWAVAIGIVVGSAANLAVVPGSLGARTVSTPRCTNAGLAVIPILSGSAVGSVTVGTLPTTCGGATLKVTVDTGSSTGSGSTTVPAGGGSVTVPITVAPTLDADVRIDILLDGP